MPTKSRSTDYHLLSMLSKTELNESLLAALDQKIDLDPVSPLLRKAKIDLLRKLGSLEAASRLQKGFIQGNHYGDTSSPDSGLRLFPMAQLDRSEFGSCPLYVLDNVFLSSVVERLWHEVVSQKTAFSKAGVGYDRAGIDNTKRDTLVLNDMGGFRSNFLTLIEELMPCIFESLSIEPFETGRMEMKYTNHLDGGFFHIHSDNKKTHECKGRAISWLYYFHQEPRQFDGGELLVFDSSNDFQHFDQRSFTKIKPLCNRFVAFPSAYYHTVMPVVMRESCFEYGRMAVTGHIHYGEH